MESNDDHGVSVITLSGRMDSATSPGIDGELAAALGAHPAGLLLDLAGVDYISSAGLRVLLKAAKQAQSSAIRFAVCNAVPAVREIFDVSGFSSLLTMHDSRDAALAAMR